jgi:hypothetical protein
MTVYRLLVFHYSRHAERGGGGTRDDRLARGTPSIRTFCFASNVGFAHNPIRNLTQMNADFHGLGKNNTKEVISDKMVSVKMVSVTI